MTNASWLHRRNPKRALGQKVRVELTGKRGKQRKEVSMVCDATPAESPVIGWFGKRR